VSSIFDVEGMDKVTEMVDHFISVEFMHAAKHGMTEALLFLHSKLPEYPDPPKQGEASKHWTDKQRRYFFWALGQGIIKAKYRRTGTLGRKFTTGVRVRHGTVFGEIGTDLPYAPWVVGPDEKEAITFGGVRMYQAPIHAGRWWKFHQVIEDNLDDAYQTFIDIWWADIRKEWNV